MTFEGHGMVGTREQQFTRLLPDQKAKFDLQALAALAAQTAVNPEDAQDHASDGPDAEENLFVPAGYTYLGQFVDHDLTFDTTSSLDPTDPTPGTNLRTPRFDLDCVYGAGPGDQPYLYASDGATMLFGKTQDGKKDDLLRIGANGRAVIGDKRNDENSIVCQIQLAFIKFHNEVVAALKKRGISDNLFNAARNEVRWTYQRILVEDYLKRVVSGAVYDWFDKSWAQSGESAYRLFTAEKRSQIPIEFAGAAYRFGHSMVRTGYRMNAGTLLDIFDQTDSTLNSLIGFDPLPSTHVIDNWGRFFPAAGPRPGERLEANTDNSATRLQYAYKIDTSLVDPLARLPKKIADPSTVPPPFGFEKPSLALLNLFRGNKFELPTGQSVAAALKVAPLDKKYLATRKKTKDGAGTFISIAPSLQDQTPLWFYILAEAAQPVVDVWLGLNGKDITDDHMKSGPAAGTQLGPVGGQMLMEVFYGLLDADPDSYRNAAPLGWSPLIGDVCTMRKLLEFANLGGTGL